MKNKILSFLCLAAAFVFSANAARGQQTALQNASDAAAIKILDKHVAALGGREAFDSVKSFEIKIERAVLGRTVKTRRVNDVAGNRSYAWQDGGAGVTETGFDGQKPWQKAPFFRGYLEPTTAPAKALTRGGINLPGAALYNYAETGKKFARLPDESIGGKNYLVIESAGDAAAKEVAVKYYFDPATYLLKQIVSGNAITQTETFDDYRAVGGITVAFASTVVNPQVTLSGKITELKFNVPFDPAIFEFRETSVPTPAAPSERLSATKETGAIKLPDDKTEGEILESLRIETFETVWKTIDDTFYDRTFNGVNWQAVHDRYLPLVKATVNADEFHRLLNRMVQELRLSHFKVIAPKNVRTLSSAATNSAAGAIGLSLRQVENRLIVSKVVENSSAARAGIKPGFVLQSVDGKIVNEIYAEYQKNNPGFQFREELARVRAVTEKLAGNPATKINLEFADALDKPLNVELIRTATPLGMQIGFESKKLAGNLGYLKFDLFFGDLLPKFQAALRQMRDTKALIIDLRGNPGGAGDLAPALANLLCSAPGSLGSLQYRYETTEYSYAGSGAQAYQGKIIVLIDEKTGSTAEVLAGGLQANKRAVVIGALSAGAVLPSQMRLLPTGGALQHVVSNFRTSRGTTLEGKGVIPDAAVAPRRADFLAGRDAALEKAVKFAETGSL